MAFRTISMAFFTPIQNPEVLASTTFIGGFPKTVFCFQFSVFSFRLYDIQPGYLSSCFCPEKARKKFGKVLVCRRPLPVKIIFLIHYIGWPLRCQ
jgi:hypothetical protein